MPDPEGTSRPASRPGRRPAAGPGGGVFEALGDPARRLILEFLAAGDQSVAAIVTALREAAPMSQPAVSQHLKVLRQARLVDVRAEGRRRFYRLDGAGLAAARGWLAGLHDPLTRFDQPLDALATEVARGRRSGRDRATDGSARQQAG